MEIFSFENLISKLDFGFIIRLCVEVILFLIFLWLVKKVIGVLFSKIVSKIQDYETKRQYATIQFMCTSIVNIVVTLFFATNILGACGIDMKPILATAGIFGVAIGFGAKRFVEDIISGLMILLTGQVRVGDYITVVGSTGTVESLNLAMIKLRSLNGDVHFIRNGLVDKVVNHTRDFSNPIVEVPVSYDADIPYIVSVLRELCNEIKGKKEFARFIMGEPEIFAIDSFGESAVNLKVRFKTSAIHQWEIKRAFQMMMKQRFDKLNISIPYNQLDVTINKN